MIIHWIIKIKLNRLIEKEVQYVADWRSTVFPLNQLLRYVTLVRVTDSRTATVFFWRPILFNAAECLWPNVMFIFRNLLPEVCVSHVSHAPKSRRSTIVAVASHKRSSSGYSLETQFPRTFLYKFLLSRNAVIWEFLLYFLDHLIMSGGLTFQKQTLKY